MRLGFLLATLSVLLGCENPSPTHHLPQVRQSYPGGIDSENAYSFVYGCFVRRGVTDIELETLKRLAKSNRRHYIRFCHDIGGVVEIMPGTPDIKEDLGVSVT
jgi:hypothetical protein